MSIERTIVQRLFEFRKLSEASFEANGSTYKCIFGKYYKDDEQIDRDDYFKAKREVELTYEPDEEGNIPDAELKKYTDYTSDDIEDILDEIEDAVEDIQYQGATVADYEKELEQYVEDLEIFNSVQTNATEDQLDRVSKLFKVVKEIRGE